MFGNRSSRAIVGGALLASALTAAPAAGEREADAVVAGVQAWLDGIRDLEGRFRQSLVSGALGAGLEESGRFYVARPGRMRWDYLTPERKVALLDGRKTWLYLEEDEQLILGRLEEGGELLPSLFAGEGRLADLFGTSLAAGLEEDPAGVYLLRLVPLGERDGFEEVLLAVRPPAFAIEAAEVLDPAGNRMLYRFSDLRRNGGLPERVFRFRAPAGTLVSGTHDAAEP